jgi:hypothetical protein
LSNPESGRARLTTRVWLEEGRRLNQGEGARTDVRGTTVKLASATGLEACIDLATGEGELTVARQGIQSALENYLRMANAILVLERGGVQVHSAGVIRDDRGYLFFGPADAGKSTTTSFSGRFHVLSDDQNVLLPARDGVRLCGVPFRSAFCPVETQPGFAPLARLLRLQQDSVDRLEDVPAGRATALLVSQCPFVNFQLDLVDRVMQNCERIVNRVPMSILHLRKGPEFWRIL